MAKMRVHELAKELEIESKNIVEFLKGTEYEVKAAASSVDEAAQEFVRKNFGKKSETPKVEEPKVEKKAEKEAPKAETPAKTAEKPAAEGEAKERPKKKSSITAVFNAQYSKQPRRPGQNNGQPRKPGARPEGERPANRDARGPKRDGAPKQEQHTIIRPRPVGERAMRPISERTKQNDDLVMTSTTTEEKVVERPQNDRPVRNDRPQGDRPARGDRPQGDRPVRNDRPQGDRPARNDRPQGDRPARGDRPQGDRPVRNDRPQGDRPNKNDRGDRNGKRFDREMDKFNKESAVAASDEVRGKESRERGNDRRNNNRHQDHDKLGKRQENYINLEKHGGKKKPQQQPQKPKEDPNEIKTITLPEKMTIKELADAMKIQPSVIIKNLFMKGTMVTMNHEVSFEEAEEIA